jgi:nitrogen fixation NifU-like protein
MLGEVLIGMSMEEARKLDKEVVLEMIGIPLTINRVKCATLSLKTLIVGSLGQKHWEKIEDAD